MPTQRLPLSYEQQVKYERAEYLVELVFNSAAKVRQFLGGRSGLKPGQSHAAA